jgi:hypothetical protein
MLATDETIERSEPSDLRSGTLTRGGVSLVVFYLVEGFDGLCLWSEMVESVD